MYIYIYVYKGYSPWMRFNCLKAKELLRRDSCFLPFSSQEFLVLN